MAASRATRGCRVAAAQRQVRSKAIFLLLLLGNREVTALRQVKESLGQSLNTTAKKGTQSCAREQSQGKEMQERLAGLQRDLSSILSPKVDCSSHIMERQQQLQVLVDRVDEGNSPAMLAELTEAMVSFEKCRGKTSQEDLTEEEQLEIFKTMQNTVNTLLRVSKQTPLVAGYLERSQCMMPNPMEPFTHASELLRKFLEKPNCDDDCADPRLNLESFPRHITDSMESCEDTKEGGILEDAQLLAFGSATWGTCGSKHLGRILHMGEARHQRKCHLGKYQACCCKRGYIQGPEFSSSCSEVCTAEAAKFQRKVQHRVGLVADEILGSKCNYDEKLFRKSPGALSRAGLERDMREAAAKGTIAQHSLDDDIVNLRAALEDDEEGGIDEAAGRLEHPEGNGSKSSLVEESRSVETRVLALGSQIAQDLVQHGTTEMGAVIGGIALILGIIATPFCMVEAALPMIWGKKKDFKWDWRVVPKVLGSVAAIPMCFVGNFFWALATICQGICPLLLLAFQ